jgi:subtilisin family serine protease
MPRDFGNSFQRATPISLQSKLTNSIGGKDKFDFLRFSLSGSSDVSVSLSRLTKSSKLTLLAGDGNTITSSSRLNKRTQQINTNLSPGTYVLRVQHTGETATYRLNLTATPYLDPTSTPPTSFSLPTPPIPPTPSPLPIPPTPSAPPTPFNSFYGYGLVNAAAAVAKAIAPTDAVTTPFPDVPDGSFIGADKAWQVDAVKAPEVWAKGFKGQGVVVAVLDTGIDNTNSYLSKSLWTNTKEIPFNGKDDDNNGFVDDTRGWDFANADNTPIDLDGHGTFVSGIIADSLTGIAPDAKIMPVKVANDEYVSQTDLANGIYYAVQNGAKIINISSGLPSGYPSSTSVQDAIKFAYQNNVLVVASAGNEGNYAVQPTNPGYFVATNNYGITVGATDKTGKFADFSNPAGSTPLNYVVAPGVDVYSDKFDDWFYPTFEKSSGTSFSAPAVSAVAALMLSANPNLTPNQIETILTSTANPAVVV